MRLLVLRTVNSRILEKKSMMKLFCLVFLASVSAMCTTATAEEMDPAILASIDLHMGQILDIMKDHYRDKATSSYIQGTIRDIEYTQKNPRLIAYAFQALRRLMARDKELNKKLEPVIHSFFAHIESLEKKKEDCDSMFNRCEETADPNLKRMTRVFTVKLGASMAAIKDYIATEPHVDIDYLCREIQPVASCIRLDIDDCEPGRRLIPPLKKRVDAILRMVDYTCSDVGKATLTEALSSHCFRNQTVEYSLKRALRHCLGDGRGGDFHCKVAHESDCLTSSATDHCGEAYGAIMAKLLEINQLSLIQPGQCDASLVQARSLVDQALEQWQQ